MVYMVGMDGLYGRYGWSMVASVGRYGWSLVHLWTICVRRMGGGGEDGADLQRISPLSGSEVVTVGSRLLSSLYIIYIYIY